MATSMAGADAPYCPSSIDCSFLGKDGLASSVPDLRPYPDISGPGVLVGFVATAYLTFVFVLLYYLAGPSSDPGLIAATSAAPSVIDYQVLGFVWKTVGRPHKAWKKALRKTVLMFSDQQLVTGIAILAGGYSQLYCGISSYHWQIIVYLAWFSSSTHLATLTVLRQYFRKHPATRNWRSFFMVSMVIALTAALIPTGNNSWLHQGTRDIPGAPTKCYFDALALRDTTLRFEVGPRQGSLMVISIFILLVSYITRIVKFFEVGSMVVRKWLRNKPGNLLKRALDMKSYSAHTGAGAVFAIIAHEILLVIYVILRATFDLYESTLLEVFWLAFGLAWGTIRLFRTRSSIDYHTGPEESFWGFGQWMPTLFMALPLLSMGETYYGFSFRDFGKLVDSTMQEIVRSSEMEVPSRTKLSSTLMRHTRVETRRELDGGCPTYDKHYLGSYESVPDNTSPQNDDRVNYLPEQTTCPKQAEIPLELVSRTGTDLSAEERSLIITDFCQQQPPSPHRRESPVLLLGPVASTAAAPGALLSGQTEGTSYHRNFYAFEWFWLLIALLLEIGIHAALWILHVVNELKYRPYALLMNVVAVSAYATLFVVLEDFKRPIRIFLEKRGGIRQCTQQRCFRLAPYLFVAVVIAYVIVISSIKPR